jgi:RHH-type proline utilization regulon transcriptional repressor/proline dehydrogenase/delta 1-pyrroline-5-carboxylate dehydrogenase
MGVEPHRTHSDLEPAIAEIGREWLAGARALEATQRSSGRDRLMEWAMRDDAFRSQLFRFVDAFPTLRGARQIQQHLEDHLSQPGVTLPSWLDLGLSAGGLLPGVVARTTSHQIEAMAGRFIAGADERDALSRLQGQWERGIAFSIDLLGEACLSLREADDYQQRYLRLIDALADRARTWPERPTLESDAWGPIPRANVSIKISALHPKVDPLDFEGSIVRLRERIEPILQLAARRDVFIHFDMEHFALKDLTLALFEDCCERWDFEAGLAMQAYLRSGDEDARRIADWSHRSGRRVTVRLVKGAYWDQEQIHARQLGWPCPVWQTKHETDACFERMAATLLDAAPAPVGDAGAGSAGGGSDEAHMGHDRGARGRVRGGVKLAIGTHNVRSIAATLAMLQARGLPESALELQMLYGMSETLENVAVARGLRLREYVPIGPMIPGMAYLVRRLLENTSNVSWLRAEHYEAADEETLLHSPHADPGLAAPTSDPGRDEPRRHRAVPETRLADPFRNEPTRDFSDASQRIAFAEALQGARVPAIEIVRDPELAGRAVGRARSAFAGWRDVPASDRAAILEGAADRMHARRDELAGVIVRESGKTWREADADVCEAIDFSRFYARHAVPLMAEQQLGDFPGEDDRLWWEPRGVAVVISPWNFPLAICTGLTTAALVMGNPVIVKPAEQAPGIASLLCELLHAAGAPEDVVQLLPGEGETVGAALVRDPRVAIIAFTGSQQVGLEILRAAAEIQPGQHHIKQVVCEMGGKNAIIVDGSADLDEAVRGVRDSAFGYAGQKCSACSRVIVVEDAYETFVSRLLESTRALRIGDPADPATDVGPVIDAAAAAKIRDYIEIGGREATLSLAMEVPPDASGALGKPFVAPHVFTDVLPDHRIAREEIFGPVLSVMRARDFEHALEIANGSGYKLTGGLFSRRPAHLERARRDFRVGNLYLNRGITGALVGRQPFGGLGLSGAGTKAGCREHLMQFAQQRASCENTTRRGFAPELGGDPAPHDGLSPDSPLHGESGAPRTRARLRGDP